MEVYNTIKNDIFKLIGIIVVITLITNIFNLLTDDTDKDGFNRSGVQLITDYATGMQYLYKGGALIPRLDKVGNHIRIQK